MTNERIVIWTREISDEDFYFQEQDRKKVKELRASAAEGADEVYRQAHRNHCFRCGTPSLVEVDHRGTKIDLCVNDQCGAIHLDPGEIEKILEGEKGHFKKLKRSLFGVFK